MGKHVHLFSERRPDLSVSVSAYIHQETKDLVIAGHDMGEFVQNFRGDSDYEYWVIIPAHEKLKLLTDLHEKGFGGRKWQPWVSDDIRLLSALKARSAGTMRSYPKCRSTVKRSGSERSFIHIEEGGDGRTKDEKRIAHVRERLFR
jgi:hypothetical protein